MTYGVLYEFERTSTNGADIRITIRQKWYEGEVKKRALGRAPVIKRDNNGHIYGTSCEIYAECLVDGEFSQLYTSDAFEFRVDVYRNEILIWQGFVSPELYSEPDIAPPYDVQIIATDGLGELKNYNFEKRGVASLLSHLNYLMTKTGVGMAYNVVSGLLYINAEGTLSGEKDIFNIYINLDHEEGNSCYDVLQNIMSSFNANITQHNGRYLIFRETDFINKVSGETVEAFDINGTRVDLPIASFGSIQSHQWWPIGQLSTVIEPAKNEVILKSPDFYKNNGLSNWNLNAGALYDDKENAYSLPTKSSSISQTLDFGVELGYRLGLRVRARNVGAGKWGIGESSEEQNLGVKIEMHGRAKADYLGNQFWLVKSEGIASGHMFSDYVWSTNDAAIGCEMSLPSAEQTAADAQNIDIVIPLFDDGTHTYGSYAYADQLKITIFNPDGIHKIYVYDVSLVKYEQTGGYEADVIINNAAREGASDIDLAMTAGDRAPEAGAFFMTGLPLHPATKNAITQWQTGNDTQDYLSAMAYDYSRAIALPKMKYSGSLNVPGSATVLPTLFLRDGTYYFPKTYSYDLYNDEMSVELISISAADVSLAAVIISQYAQPSETMGASTTGTASPGGTAISFPRDTEMSETSDNAVENRVIKAYVDKKVLDLATVLASMWTIENGQLVATKDVYIKANLIVNGDTASGGSGSNTPASGTVTGINVNGTPYEPNTQGVIDLSSAFNSIDVSGQLGDYAKKSEVSSQFALVNSALTGKQDAITSSNKLPYSLISGTPTIPTVPTNVSAFTNDAKYATQSDVNGEILDLSTQLKEWVNDKGYISDITSAMVTGALGYIPLSTNGGSITNGELNLVNSYIKFFDDNYTLLGAFNVNASNGEPIYLKGDAWQTLLHSGNYSSYALRLSGNQYYRFADYTGETGLLTQDTSQNNTWYIVGKTNDYNVLLHSGNIGSYALPLSGGTINGNLNVYGAITRGFEYAVDTDIAGNVIFKRNDTVWTFSKSDTSAIIAINGGSGNVGIGTTTDDGYKLDVNGDISAMSALRIGGCGTSYCGLYPNSQITSNGQNSKLWLYNDSGLVLYGTSIEMLNHLDVVGNVSASGYIEGSFTRNAGMASTMYFTSTQWLRIWKGTYGSAVRLQIGKNYYHMDPMVLCIDASIGYSSAAISVTCNADAANTSIQAIRVTKDTSGNYYIDVLIYNAVVDTDVFRVCGNSALGHIVAFETADNSATVLKQISVVPNSSIISNNLIVSGNVGIGTTNPYYNLDVNGTARFTDAVTMSSTLRANDIIYSDVGIRMGGSSISDISIGVTTSYGSYHLGSDVNGGYIYCNSGYIMQWNLSSRNVTVGSNLIVSGDTASGSDIRFKDVIDHKTIRIEDIANAPLFTFKWNDREDDTIHMGSSAQYWDTITPQLVSGEEFKTLNYAGLGVAMGISLAKEVVALRKEVKELKEKLYGSVC